MENREQKILSEIKSMMSSIRSQLEMLDAKMAELQHVVDPEEFEAEPIDISIDVTEEVDDLPEVLDLPEDTDLPEVLEPLSVTLPEPVVIEPVIQDPFAEGPEIGKSAVEEQLTIAAKAEETSCPTINDVMAASHAWRKDMPGTPVKDIRSAISLNDRVIFINLLFDEDAQMFVNALTRINTMETLDQVVEYVCSEFPSWDLDSELVYRFMMAVRRKVR